jgi:glycosyltransferase involved in cell wall biosynthesis
LRKFDKVFVHREATPIGPPWFEWAVVQLFRKPLIYDFDDAIWLPNSSKANEKLAGRLKFHGKTAKICSWATTCSVGNAFLADYAKQFCDDVRVIPTTVDTDNWHNPNLYEKTGNRWKRKKEFSKAAGSRLQAGSLRSKDSKLQEKVNDEQHTKERQSSTESPKTTERPEAESQQPEAKKQPETSQQSTKSSFTKEQHEAGSLKPQASKPAQTKTTENLHPSRSENEPPVTIGWTGTHSTLKQLTPLFPLLNEIHQTHPFRFLLIADIPPEPLPDFVEFRKWKKETEIEDLMEIDIGIMPLFDTDWERGKCGFKALQYMALEKPAVVSAVGVNREIVQDEKTGYTCEPLPLQSSQNWKTALIKLLQNPAKRTSLGTTARQLVIDHYSVRSQKEAYKRVFNV